ncbi:FAS-associated death domain protein-like [Saccoglossus kowalevskii]
MTGPPLNKRSFMERLHDVAKEIDMGELKDMKYLCRGDADSPVSIPKAGLEKIESPMGLFLKLKEQGSISKDDTRLLEYLLNKIRRKDLVKLLHDKE